MRKSTKKLYRQVGASVVVLVILVAVAGMPMASGATTEEAARQPSGQASSTTEASATPGGVTGEAATTVEHPLEWTAVEVDGKDRGSGLVMPEGTHFAVDARVVAGGTYRLHLGLANRSTRRQVAILEIDAPEALALKMTPYKGRSEQVEVVSLSGNRWAVGLPPETDDSGADAYELTVSVSVPVQALPGKATLGFTAEPADIESLQ